MFKERFKPDPNDFVIVIMGVTGSGKTNFINKLTGNREHPKAHGLQPDTQSITPYTISYQGLRLVLVDTPGFSNTYRPDGEISRVISDWLVQKYRYPNDTTLNIAGIIYLHRITDNRMSDSTCTNLQMFGRLCGDIPLLRTCLVTTMWDQVRDQTVATRRETQLVGDFWQVLIDEGATIHQFHNTPDSAMDIIVRLLSFGKEGEELLLQEEFIEPQERLNETEAAKVLYNQLQKLLSERRNVLRELSEEANLRSDPALVKNLQEAYDKINMQLQNVFEEIKGMKIRLSRHVLLWLSGRKSHVKAAELGCA